MIKDDSNFKSQNGNPLTISIIPIPIYLFLKYSKEISF